MVMVAAGVFGGLCQRIGLSVMVGYLAAGVSLGPCRIDTNNTQDEQ